MMDPFQGVTMRGKKLLITGPAGQIAFPLAEELAQHNEVWGIARFSEPGSQERCEKVGIRTVVCDLAKGDFSALPDDFEYLLHLATFQGGGLDYDQAIRVNAEGTAALATAAMAAGVGRFVFVSTSKVMGEKNREGPFRETDAPAPEDAYALSKWAGEKAVLDVCRQGRMQPVIVRPPLVYGPGAKGNMLALLKLCRMAPPLPLAAVDNRRSLIAVANLADALAVCVRHPKAAGQIYFVSDGEDISTPELVRRLGAALGRPAKLFPMPTAVLRYSALLVGQTAVAGRLIESLQVDDQKIRRELRWTPPVGMVKALGDMAAWFASRGVS